MAGVIRSPEPLAYSVNSNYLVGSKELWQQATKYSVVTSAHGSAVQGHDQQGSVPNGAPGPSERLGQQHL